MITCMYHACSIVTDTPQPHPLTLHFRPSFGEETSFSARRLHALWVKKKKVGLRRSMVDVRVRKDGWKESTLWSGRQVSVWSELGCG